MPDQLPQPPSLADLVTWIDQVTIAYKSRIASQYPQMIDQQAVERNLQLLEALLTGSTLHLEVTELVRLLIAQGILNAHIFPSSVNSIGITPSVTNGLITAALWPLIIVPKLPDEWDTALQNITSDAIVELVKNYRSIYLSIPQNLIVRIISRNPKTSISPEEIAMRINQELNKTQYANGILNLLEDLRNPALGGSALNSLITAKYGMNPPKYKDIPTFLHVFLGGAIVTAVQGVLGNRADALVVNIWEYFAKSTEEIVLPSPSPQDKWCMAFISPDLSSIFIKPPDSKSIKVLLKINKKLSDVYISGFQPAPNGYPVVLCCTSKSSSGSTYYLLLDDKITKLPFSENPKGYLAENYPQWSPDSRYLLGVIQETNTSILAIYDIVLHSTSEIQSFKPNIKTIPAAWSRKCDCVIYCYSGVIWKYCFNDKNKSIVIDCRKITNITDDEDNPAIHLLHDLETLIFRFPWQVETSLGKHIYRSAEEASYWSWISINGGTPRKWGTKLDSIDVPQGYGKILRIQQVIWNSFLSPDYRYLAYKAVRPQTSSTASFIICEARRDPKNILASVAGGHISWSPDGAMLAAGNYDIEGTESPPSILIYQLVEGTGLPKGKPVKEAEGWCPQWIKLS